LAKTNLNTDKHLSKDGPEAFAATEGDDKAKAAHIGSPRHVTFLSFVRDCDFSPTYHPLLKTSTYIVTPERNMRWTKPPKDRNKICEVEPCSAVSQKHSATITFQL